jgi:hypothetical protein
MSISSTADNGDEFGRAASLDMTAREVVGVG